MKPLAKNTFKIRGRKMASFHPADFVGDLDCFQVNVEWFTKQELMRFMAWAKKKYSFQKRRSK